MNSLADTTDTQNFTLTVTNEDRENFSRLDVYLTEKLPFSRSTIKRMFEDEEISSEVKLSLNKMPPTGALIEIEVPPPVTSDLIAENIPLDILFEDAHLIIINKPAGLVVHPAPGHYTGTLVNAILYHCGSDLKGIGAEKRPGIVHRLDMGTSGVMVVAKDQKTHEGLVSLFSVHDIERKYEALVGGKPATHSGTITTTIGRHPTNRHKMAANVKNGKSAVTHYKTLKQYEGAAHMELRLQTGRTHQIRVHMSQMLHTPVLCDPVYGGSDSHIKRAPASIRQQLSDYPYQLLHAKELGFIHPMTKEKLHFTAAPPEIFQAAIRAFSE